MHINVGIVEDDPLYTKELSEKIHQWENQNYCKIQLTAFDSVEAVLSNGFHPFDLLFLDIQLKDGNGVDLAKQMRENNYTGELVFLTSFQEYVFEGYHVHALNYLLKPASYESIKNCLDSVFSNIHDDNYIYRYRDCVVRLPYHSIIYFSSSNHQTAIHTTTGETLLQTESLRNILQHLPDQFVRCHRTTVINMQHVLQISSRDITLSNHLLLPASVTYIDEIRAAFIAQIK